MFLTETKPAYRSYNAQFWVRPDPRIGFPVFEAELAPLNRDRKFVWNFSELLPFRKLS